MRTLAILCILFGFGASPALSEPLNLIEMLTGRPTYSTDQPAARPVVRVRQDLRPMVVEYPTIPANTIIISASARRLYYGLGNGRAIRYAIGVGRDGMGWIGTVHVGAKKEWPSWTPPADMLRRRPDLPRFMEGGIENPLGARALYLFAGGKDTMYRIHGTNEPGTIGQAVSSGCFRMMNDDVIDLYTRVQVGTTVTVIQ